MRCTLSCTLVVLASLIMAVNAQDTTTVMMYTTSVSLEEPAEEMSDYTTSGSLEGMSDYTTSGSLEEMSDYTTSGSLEEPAEETTAEPAEEPTAEPAEEPADTPHDSGYSDCSAPCGGGERLDTTLPEKRQKKLNILCNVFPCNATEYCGGPLGVVFLFDKMCRHKKDLAFLRSKQAAMDIFNGYAQIRDYSDYESTAQFGLITYDTDVTVVTGFDGGDLAADIWALEKTEGRKPNVVGAFEAALDLLDHFGNDTSIHVVVFTAHKAGKKAVPAVQNLLDRGARIHVVSVGKKTKSERLKLHTGGLEENIHVTTDYSEVDDVVNDVVHEFC